ncbi:TetR/AcrR family transcriptional regulator [Streptomyces sp. NPDC001930]|uniref:TetR/AcrR family transcriptional regulator n=1 Tax=Streptomyces sp. NPDC001930 TaxID=3364625 RepID=UPI0036C2446D
MTARIKDEARRRLAAQGAQQLSVRAVARELGMASSTVYRYFPSREHLVTALTHDAHDTLGRCAERALDSASGAAAVDRWNAVCRAVRTWALLHPHEYVLVYGPPALPKAAPAAVGPAARLARTLLRVASDAHAGDVPDEPPAGRPCAGVGADTGRPAAELSCGLPADHTTCLTAVMAQLLGLVAFEVLGQFDHVVQAREEFFAHTCAGFARQAGIGV